MKNGTILLWDKRKTQKGFRWFISFMIAKLTHGDYTHSAIFLNNRLFEQDKLPDGREGMIVSIDIRKADLYLEPVEDLSDENSLEMELFIEHTYGGRKYNIMKLLLMAFLGVLKPVFRLWKWMPFDKPWFGEVCSVMPDEAYKSVGIDLFPKEFEGYTAPGDYVKTDKLQEREI